MPGLDFYTKICLHGDGTDASTSFPDSSFRARLFTSTNHAQVDTAQKVFGTGSMLFDGDDYISTPGSDDFRFGTGNFTLDFWVRWNGTPGASDFMGIGNSGPWNNKWLIGWNTAATGLCLHFWDGSGAHTLSWAWSPSASTWYHVALVRSGNTFTAYIDGTSIGTPGTDTGSLDPADANGLCIGTDGEQWQYFNGWLDEVRISKGIARWTSNFTPPEEAYSSDTALVYGIDQYTKLMLHCNGDDASTYFPDSSSSSHVVTADDDAQVDTAQSRFGDASGLFDGTDDFLSIPNSDDFNFGSGNFTVDFWVRFSSVSGTQVFIGRNGSSDRGWSMYYTSSNLHFAWQDGSGYHDQSFSWSPVVSCWYHIAAVRNSVDLKTFVDGAQVGSTYSIGSETIRSSSSIFYIAENVEDRGYYFTGWLDEIRISKGVARWTASFTPPSDEYRVTLPVFHQTTNTAVIVFPTSVQK